MGCWDSFCLVCAGPSTENNLSHKELLLPAIGKTDGDLKWLSQHAGIPETDIPLDIGCWNMEGGFTYPGQEHKSLNAMMRFHPAWKGFGHGLTCHEACFKFLQSRLNYTLQFQDIWPLLQREVERSYKHLKASELLDDDYGGMQKYVSDFLDCYKVHVDDNAWMLLNPNESKQNAQRILDVWFPLITSDSFRQARQARLEPRLVALLCSFCKAGHLAADTLRRSKKVTAWRSMAAMPSSVVC